MDGDRENGRREGGGQQEWTGRMDATMPGDKDGEWTGRIDSEKDVDCENESETARGQQGARMDCRKGRSGTGREDRGARRGVEALEIWNFVWD